MCRFHPTHESSRRGGFSIWEPSVAQVSSNHESFIHSSKDAAVLLANLPDGVRLRFGPSFAAAKAAATLPGEGGSRAAA